MTHLVHLARLTTFMRVPKRRSEQSIKRDEGPFLVTKEALDRLHKTLERLEKSLPKLIAEVEHTKSHGDFSENAAYQDAKATLRRTHNRIASLKDRIKRAVLIEKGPSSTGEIQVGSTVILETNGRQMTFEILGSHESDPGRGRISNQSPLGKLLLGKKPGDRVELTLPERMVSYKILEVR